MAQSLAFRYRRPGTSPDDINQVAYLGLACAIARFAPCRGPTFSRFAVRSEIAAGTCCSLRQASGLLRDCVSRIQATLGTDA